MTDRVCCATTTMLHPLSLDWWLQDESTPLRLLTQGAEIFAQGTIRDLLILVSLPVGIGLMHLFIFADMRARL